MQQHYRVTIEFTSDRPLTEDEIDMLAVTLYIQVDEPVDEYGENAEWASTGDRASIKIESILEREMVDV